LTEMRKELRLEHEQVMTQDEERHKRAMELAETAKINTQEIQVALAEMRKELQARHEQAKTQDEKRHKLLMEMVKTGRIHRFGVLYWVGLGLLIGMLAATLGAALWTYLT